eukprot:SAG11_NODE_6288_length_1344_cov_0.857831_3_plen_70_part_00
MGCSRLCDCECSRCWSACALTVAKIILVILNFVDLALACTLATYSGWVAMDADACVIFKRDYSTPVTLA